MQTELELDGYCVGFAIQTSRYPKLDNVCRCVVEKLASLLAARHSFSVNERVQRTLTPLSSCYAAYQSINQFIAESANLL